FKDEARLAALLNHPNVVQTNEVGEDDGNIYTVMEYLEGETLQGVLNYVKRSKATEGLTLDMRIRVVIDVLNGLHYTHELRDFSGHPLSLVHRDVSPHNIFITYDGSIKLLDFGIAKTTSASSTTHVGTIKGKVAYMAPEQVANPNRISRKTDIFQVGLVLWEGVIGHRIWEGLMDCDVLVKLANNAALPGDAPADADPELVRICRRAMATSPDDRYQTAEEFASELENYLLIRGIRTRSKDVGAFVARIFSEHRQALREVIQRRLRDIEFESVDRIAELGLPNLCPNPLGGDKDSSLRGRTRGSSLSNVRSPRPAAGEWTGVRLTNTTHWKFGAAALLGGALVAAAVNFMHAGTAGGRTSDSAVESATPSAGPTTIPTVGTIQLSIIAIPTNARLFLDNAPLPSNPYRAEVKQDAVTHVVRADAAGYTSSSLTLRFDRNSDNVIELRPLPAQSVTANPDPAVLAKASSRPPPRGRLAKPATGSSTRTNVQTQPSTPSPSSTSGQSTPVNVVKTPAVKLDAADPWR
ncbi:MAG TPA: serine/threonine-protein kinase, partial [Polyangiaceae bacterium]